MSRPKLLTVLVESTIEIFRLYQTFHYGKDAYDEEIGGPYATKAEALKAARTLKGRWFVTVTGIVAESESMTADRAKRMVSAD